MNLQRALSDVAEMRSQLERASHYRGFRSTATGLSALIVVVGAVIQSHFEIHSVTQIDAYLTVWLGVAIASSAIAGGEMILRGYLSGNRQVWKTHRTLIGNLLPSLVVGAVLTGVIASQATGKILGAGNLMWALPSLWAIVFGCGLFACRDALPIAAMWVAAFYMVGGMMSLFVTWTIPDTADWQMVGLFGVGQALLGWVLWWNVERKDAYGE